MVVYSQEDQYKIAYNYVRNPNYPSKFLPSEIREKVKELQGAGYESWDKRTAQIELAKRSEGKTTGTKEISEVQQKQINQELDRNQFFNNYNDNKYVYVNIDDLNKKDAPVYFGKENAEVKTDLYESNKPIVFAKPIEIETQSSQAPQIVKPLPDELKDKTIQQKTEEEYYKRQNAVITTSISREDIENTSTFKPTSEVNIRPYTDTPYGFVEGGISQIVDPLSRVQDTYQRKVISPYSNFIIGSQTIKDKDNFISQNLIESPQSVSVFGLPSEAKFPKQNNNYTFDNENQFNSVTYKETETIPGAFKGLIVDTATIGLLTMTGPAGITILGSKGVGQIIQPKGENIIEKGFDVVGGVTNLYFARQGGKNYQSFKKYQEQKLIIKSAKREAKRLDRIPSGISSKDSGSNLEVFKNTDKANVRSKVKKTYEESFYDKDGRLSQVESRFNMKTEGQANLINDAKLNFKEESNIGSKSNILNPTEEGVNRALVLSQKRSTYKEATISYNNLYGEPTTIGVIKENTGSPNNLVNINIPKDTRINLRIDYDPWYKFRNSKVFKSAVASKDTGVGSKFYSSSLTNKAKRPDSVGFITEGKPGETKIINLNEMSIDDSGLSTTLKRSNVVGSTSTNSVSSIVNQIKPTSPTIQTIVPISENKIIQNVNQQQNILNLQNEKPKEKTSTQNKNNINLISFTQQKERSRYISNTGITNNNLIDIGNIEKSKEKQNIIPNSTSGVIASQKFKLETEQVKPTGSPNFIPPGITPFNFKFKPDKPLPLPPNINLPDLNKQRGENERRKKVKLKEEKISGYSPTLIGLNRPTEEKSKRQFKKISNMVYSGLEIRPQIEIINKRSKKK